MTERDAAVRVKGVSHQFGEAGETQYVRALADTSLDIARGELLCLIGPSGCGKSTLLNVIGGLMTPTSGAVEVAGKPVRAVMEVAGIHNVLTKSIGTTNPHNVIKATFDALRHLKSRESVAAMRGKTVQEL